MKSFECLVIVFGSGRLITSADPAGAEPYEIQEAPAGTGTKRVISRCIHWRRPGRWRIQRVTIGNVGKMP